MRAPQLLPARLHRPALLLALAGWLVAAVLGVRYAGGQQAGALDRSLTDAVYALVGGRASHLAQVLVTPTDPVVVYVVLILMLVVAIVRRRWELAGLAVAAPGGAVLLTEYVFKPLLDRRHDGSLSYPSGHTVSAVCAFTVALLAITAGQPAARRALAVLAWLVLTLVVMTGLVAMDYHYPTDTIGGVGLALGTVLPGALLADRLALARARRTGVSPGTPAPARS